MARKIHIFERVPIKLKQESSTRSWIENNKKVMFWKDNHTRLKQKMRRKIKRIYQIITRNSKYDSSPICRYWEEGAEVADIDNSIGSTENKRRKKPMWWWLLDYCLERDRKTVLGGGDSPRQYTPTLFPTLSPSSLHFAFSLP